MRDDVDNQAGAIKRAKLLKGLDRMVESGRVSKTEAAQLRASTDPREFERAVQGIRVRHAGEKLNAAVDGGQMTQLEADESLERLKQGEHPRSLRAQLGRLVRGGH